MNAPLPTPSADEELFASIRLTPIASVITDRRKADNPIVAVNEAFCRLTGYAEGEILGRNCRFLAGPKTEPAAQALLREAVRTVQPVLVLLLNYRKDGTPFRNAVMIAPVLDGEGHPAYFLGSQMEAADDGGAGQAGCSGAAKAQVAALTRRQRQVLAHMVAGYRNKQIAGLLGIDEKTVKMHRAALLVRLDANSSAHAIRIGVEAGLEIASAE